MVFEYMSLSVVENIDCMTRLREAPDNHWDLAICDPPYGIRRDEGFEGFGGFGTPIARKKYKGWGDDETPTQEYFDHLLRVAEKVIIWGGQFFTDKLPQAGHWVFWDKQNTMPTFGDGELAYTNFERGSVKRVICQWNGLLGREKDERIHATQKPIKLYKWLLTNYAKQGDTILDTHLGSGSSRIAAYDLGFDFTAFELDHDYWLAQEERFARHIAQPQLFEIPRAEPIQEVMFAAA